MPNPLVIDDHSPQTFSDLLESIYQQRYTGAVPIVLHCHNGVAKAADIGGQFVRVAFTPCPPGTLPRDPA